MRLRDFLTGALATLEAVFQQLFPQLNLHHWAGTIYAWLTHPVLDPTHSGRVTMDNLMKLVTTALEWTYEAGETNMRAERLKSAAELLVLRYDTLWIIDGAGPTVPVEDQSAETKDRANGNEPEQQTVQENEHASPTETVGTAKEPVQTSTALR
ncbi:MAG TPA: ATP-binding protein, partial [Ktedonobacteraceae bacterium]